MKISSKARNRSGHVERSSRDDGLNMKMGIQERKSKPTVPMLSNRAHLPSARQHHHGTRNNLKVFLEAIEKLDVVFEGVECYGQEIPCVRSVRELAQRLKIQLDNDYGTFNRVLKELKEAHVSGVARITMRVEALHLVVSDMVYDDVDYIQNLESVRQCLGEMSGLVETIMNVEHRKR